MPSSPGTINFPTSLDDVISLIEATNDASTTLGATLSAGATTATVASTTYFPSSGTLVIDSEIITYTGKTGTTFTGLTRGAESTSDASHSNGATVKLEITAAFHNVLASAVIAAQTKIGSSSSTPTSGTVLRGTGSGTSAWGAVVNADVSASAAIALSKLATVTASRALVSDGSGNISASSVTSTELGYLSGVTSAIQTQIDAKGVGTVTSVALSLPAIFSVSGSPVTGSGTLTASLATQVANRVWAGPTTGADAAPTFRALVAGDIPDLSSVYQPLDSDLTAIAALTTTSFGRGLLTETNAASLKTTLSLGNVENTALSTWAGSTSLTTLGTIATGTWNGTAIGAQYGGTGINTSASTGYPSISSGTWSVVGATTLTAALDAFTGDSGSGGVKGLVPAPAAGDAAANKYLKADGTWATAGGGSAADPTASVGLSATNGVASTFMRSDAAPALSQSIAPTWTGVHTFSPSARSSGVAPYFKITTPADTGITADTEGPGIVFGGNSSHATVTRTLADGTTLATQREYVFVAPTYAAAGATTITTAATVAITGAPAAGTNATITASAGLWDQSGKTLSGDVFQTTINSTSKWIQLADTSNAANATLGSGSISVLELVRSTSKFMIYTDATTTYLGTNSAHNLIFRSSNSNRGQIDSSGLWSFGSNHSASGQVHIVSQSASRVGLRVDSAASPSQPIFEVRVNGTADTALEVDGDSTAGNTRLLIYDVDNATLERVSVGAADSGGTGFKVLRIPN